MTKLVVENWTTGNFAVVLDYDGIQLRSAIVEWWDSFDLPDSQLNQELRGLLKKGVFDKLTRFQTVLVNWVNDNKIDKARMKEAIKKLLQIRGGLKRQKAAAASQP